MRSIPLSIFLFGLMISVNTQMPTGEEILKRIDQNQVFDQAISTSTMIVHSRTGDRTIPPSDGPRLARLTDGRLWTLPGVAHTKAFDTDRAAYVATVDEFVRSVVG